MSKSTALHSKSFRLPPDVFSFLNTQSKTLGTSQTDILVRSVQAQMNSSTDVANLPKYISGGSIKGHKITTPNLEVMQILKSLGVGTACGIAGYHISGFVREQMELDENKGTQMAIGLLFGLLGTIGTTMYLNNNK
jgi:hypothetical protein